MTQSEQDQASASVPVAAVVTGEGMTWLRDRMILRAFRTKGATGLNPTGHVNLTIKGFNEAYGARCKSWAQIVQVAHYLLSLED